MHRLLIDQIAAASSGGSLDVDALLAQVSATYDALEAGAAPNTDASGCQRLPDDSPADSDGNKAGLKTCAGKGTDAGEGTGAAGGVSLREQAADQLRTLLDSIGEGMLTFDGNNRILDANASAALLLGCPPERLGGMSLHDLLPASVLEDGTVPEDEFGHVVRMFANGAETVLLVKRGDLPAITGQRNILLIRDITAPVRAREELDVSRRKFRDYAESSSDWLWEVDRGFTLTQVIGPQTWLRDTLLHIPSLRSLQPYSANDAVNDFDSLLVAHESFRNFLFRIPGPDGETRVLSLSGKPVFLADGQFGGYRGTASDISTQELTRERLEATEAKLMAALSGISEGFTLFDENDRLLLCNARYRQMYQMTADVLTLGIHFEDIVRISAERGLYKASADRSVAALVQDRKERHAVADGTPFEIHTCDGRWFRVAEYRTPDGGRIGIHSDITATVELQQALQAAKEEAEAASRAKSEFLSAMSHELRTPLNAVLGFAQLLAVSRRDPLTPKQIEHVEHIRRSGNHLLTLINEVLDLARIESGTLTLTPEALAIAMVVQDCLGIAQPLASTAGVRIEVSPSVIRAPRVYADYTRLKQVIINLLSNAIKYNVPDGSVTISVASGQGELADRVRVMIADTGRGIPQGRLTDLFQPFNRLGVEASGIEGTGIGLKVTRDLVLKMGGTIGVDSQEGTGSTFWFELPAAERPTGTGRSSRRMAEERWPVEATSGTEGLDGEPRFAHRRLLYIEHRDAEILALQSVVADLDGVSLVTVPALDEGLFAAHAEWPDAIVVEGERASDRVPGALDLLRAGQETERVPVLVLLPDDPSRWLDCGIDEAAGVYGLPMPLTSSVLSDVLGRAFRQR